jgi:hypothetical protein
VQTVCELSSFIVSAKSAGMSEGEKADLIDLIAAEPDAGELIVGSGGCRKLRLAGKGKGKSGGYRIITYFYSHDTPVYLLLAFAKNQMANLSKSQVNELAAITKVLKNG